MTTRWVDSMDEATFEAQCHLTDAEIRTHERMREKTDEATFTTQCHVLEDALNHKKAWSYVVDKPGYHFEATVEGAGDAS